MADKQTTQPPQADEAELSKMSKLQDAGMGNMMGMSTAWMEAMSDMSAEVASFVAERIKEDVKTQHAMLHCKNVAELQHIQSEFIQKALEQYQAESGKLLDMGTKAFARKSGGKSD